MTQNISRQTAGTDAFIGRTKTDSKANDTIDTDKVRPKGDQSRIKDYEYRLTTWIWGVTGI